MTTTEYVTGWQAYADLSAGRGTELDLEGLTNVRVYGPAHAVVSGARGHCRAECGQAVVVLAGEVPWPPTGVNPDGNCDRCVARLAPS